MKRKMMGLLVMLVFVGIMGAMPVMAEDPVEIRTAADLTAFATRVNNGETSLNAVLMEDIALRDTSNWTTWNAATQPTDINTIPAWTPIGNTVKLYGGTFDGAGHTISGIYINAPDLYGQGLFGQCEDSANIKNLKITASYLKGADYTGGIAGMSSGTITNCQIAATVVGQNYIGGVAGKAYNNIYNSYNTGSVEGKNTVGGDCW